MKHYRTALLALATLITVPALAQQGKTVGQTAIQNLPAKTAKPPVIKPVKTADALPRDISQKRVTVTLKNASAEEALTQLLDQSGYGYQFDGVFYSETLTPTIVNGKYVDSSVTLDLPPRRVTMKIVNASFPKALTSLCEVLGIGWNVDNGTERDVPTITIVRTGATVTREEILKKQGGGGFGGGGLGGGYTTESQAEDRKRHALPDQQVTVEATDKPVRELLINLLKSANVEYAFDDDVSEAPAVTVALKNVSVFTALNALCESAGLGWTTEDRQTSSNVGKRFIRVGKIYATKTQ